MFKMKDRLTYLLILVGVLSFSNADVCRLSNVFGDHMVLQHGTTITIWGFANSGTTVKATIKGGDGVVATTGSDGIWRAQFKSMAASLTALEFDFACSTGETFGLRDVLLGEVVLCSGQSNMQFTIAQLGEQDGYSASAELATVPNYPYIRTTTVGDLNTSSIPLMELASPSLMPWSLPSNASIGDGNWTATSAVCWFYGKNLFESLKDVPIGLISSNWGGTPIEAWSDADTNARCPLPSNLQKPESFHQNQIHSNLLRQDKLGSNYNFESDGDQPAPGQDSVLFNAMIYPYTVGPMGLSSIIWFQGESNFLNIQRGHDVLGRYACQQNAMVNSWRDYFKIADLWFGFVELEPWCFNGDAALAEFRASQLSTATNLSNVGYAIGTDIGDPLGPFSSIHPRNKALVGARLANTALNMQYNVKTQPIYIPPSYVSATDTSSGTTLSAAITLDLHGDTSLELTEDHCKTDIGVAPGTCAWFTLTSSDNTVYNASVTISQDGKSLLLGATTSGSAPAKVVATSFGWGIWPINTIQNKEGLPLQPWNMTL